MESTSRAFLSSFEPSSNFMFAQTIAGAFMIEMGSGCSGSMQLASGASRNPIVYFETVFSFQGYHFSVAVGR